MPLKGGYTGKVLRVDLNSRTYCTEELDLKVAAGYLGGAGLGIKFLYDAVRSGIDPVSPENVLIFTPGPLTGSDAPCASRMAVTTKSPLTGGVGMALTGGYFPAEMKFAGIDVLVIEGKAEEPTYLFVKDGEVHFRSAKRLWGMLTSDTQTFIKEEVGDHNVRVACIGPAGERLSRIACIINERRAAGRKGVGAVMGSKNLKAIAVRGTGKVGIADPEGFREALKNMHNAMKESPVLYPSFSKRGTSIAVDATAALGILAAKNYYGTGVFSPMDTLGSEALDQFTIRREHCYRCPVGCSQTRLVIREDYSGFVTEGPEFETIYSLGTCIGVDYAPAVITGDRLCDEYGLDSISAGVTIAFAMELFERSILSLSEVDNLDLRFGNHKVVLELLRKMAFREGFGDVLADGTKRTSQKIGRGSEQYAMHVKGLELPAYDVRGAKAHGLNYATSYTGADHNRGYAFQEIFGIPVPEAVDPKAYEGKGKLCKWNQDVRTATCDCPTMCAFLLDMALPTIALQNTAAMVSTISGLSLSAEDVKKAGERVNNLARMFNIREGFGRADDTLPKRLMEEPIPEGNSRGEKIAPADLDRILDEYYEARGWNKATGIPTTEKLKELGLEDTIKDIPKP